MNNTKDTVRDLSNINIITEERGTIPLTEYVSEQISSEILDHANKEVRDKSVGIHAGIRTKFSKNISGEKSQRRDFASTGLSEEVKQHVNYLQKYEGDNAVKEYINSNGTENGSLERAVFDLKSKLSKIGEAREQLTIEENQLKQAILNVESALQIITGKSSKVVTHGASDKTIRGGGTWREAVEAIMRARNGTMSRADLAAELRAKGASYSVSYAVIGTEKKAGRILLGDDNNTLTYIRQAS